MEAVSDVKVFYTGANYAYGLFEQFFTIEFACSPEEYELFRNHKFLLKSKQTLQDLYQSELDRIRGHEYKPDKAC